MYIKRALSNITLGWSLQGLLVSYTASSRHTLSQRPCSVFSSNDILRQAMYTQKVSLPLPEPPPQSLAMRPSTSSGRSSPPGAALWNNDPPLAAHLRSQHSAWARTNARQVCPVFFVFLGAGMPHACEDFEISGIEEESSCWFWWRSRASSDCCCATGVGNRRVGLILCL